jgi:hypothetical protein
VSTTSPYGGPCSRCLSFPCRCSSYNPPPAAQQPNDYFVLLRIAVALERIAEALDADREAGS